MAEPTAATGSAPHQGPDAHRRRAAYLYGFIVSGAVLATAAESYRIGRVAIALLGTLLIYWASETYAHWMAARAQLGRPLLPAERRLVVLDGWPLVTACAVPLVVLLVEALLRVEDSLAVDIALGINTLLLLVLGYRMSRESGITGWRLWASSAFAGLLGLAIIAMKAALK